MNRKERLHWLRDRVVPTLVLAPPKEAPVEPAWPAERSYQPETLEAAYEALKEELRAQDDRAKTVETRLLSVSSLAPVSMTIMVAVVTFLTSEKAREFTWGSVLVMGLVGSYVALQFLVALLAAVNGLGRRSFSHLSIKDIVPQPNEAKDAYLRRTCAELAEMILQNSVAVDDKVGQLARAHEAIKNAVWGLLLILITILLFTIVGTYA